MEPINTQTTPNIVKTDTCYLHCKIVTYDSGFMKNNITVSSSILSETFEVPHYQSKTNHITMQCPRCSNGFDIVSLSVDRKTDLFEAIKKNQNMVLFGLLGLIFLPWGIAIKNWWLIGFGIFFVLGVITDFVETRKKYNSPHGYFVTSMDHVLLTETEAKIVAEYYEKKSSVANSK